MMLRRRRRRSGLPVDQQPDEPPMTPMIDIVFQLLVFFLLTMNFKEVEGKLMSQLPKTHGMPSRTSDVWSEVRIVICADGDTRMHLHDKGRHEKAEKPGVVCTVMVEKLPVGEVYRTESDPGKADHNRSVYRALGAKVAEIRPTVRDEKGRPARVILDADSEVPYEHVIGAVNACKEYRIDNIEFVGNSKFTKYYLGQ